MAARFFVVGGVDTNWSTIGNWSLTSGGAGGQTVPSAADDVTFDANSGSACVLNTATAKVAKTLVTTNFTGTLTFNVQLSVSGGITIGTGTAFAGTTTNKLRMIAAGTWTTNGVTIPQDVEIGGTTTFTCTLASALTISGALTLTNTTSTIFSGAFAVTAPSCAISGSQTVTIANNMTINGTLTIADNTVLNGAFNWNAAGLTATGDITSGTSTVVLTGGTWSGAGQVGCALTFAGNVTVSGTVHIGASGIAVTWTSGTITTTGSTLSIDTACTLNTAGMSWANITITAAVTVTINSLLSASGTLTMPNAAVTFAGTAGFTVGTFTNTTITATRIWTFTFGNTYTITTLLDTVSAAAQTVRFTLKSSSAGNKVAFILAGGATQDVGFADPTDLDSSGGQTIFSYHGVITTTTNWASSLPVNVLPAGTRIVQTIGNR